MKKITKLSESDLNRLVKKVLSEQPVPMSSTIDDKDNGIVCVENYLKKNNVGDINQDTLKFILELNNMDPIDAFNSGTEIGIKDRKMASTIQKHSSFVKDALNNCKSNIKYF